MKSFSFILFSLIAFAQQSQSQEHSPFHGKDSISYGFQLGLGFTNFSGKQGNDQKLQNQNLVRLRAGLNMNIPLSQLLALRPELLYSPSGFKSNDSVVSKTHVSYLKFSTNFVFNTLPINSIFGKSMLKFGVGPYLAYAMHGAYIVKSKEENKITFTNHGVNSGSSYQTYYKRFDSGINGFVEISTNNFYWQAGTSFGLFNIKPPLGSGKNQAIYRNRSINLSYGIRF